MTARAERDAPTPSTGDAVTVPEAAGASDHGATIGRFVVLGSLGAGGMGVVLSAFDPELDRKVAIKLLRPDAWSSGDGRARLVREARAMARLSHPNVVAVYDVGSVGAQPFVAMELIDGDNLRGWLNQERRSWREILAALVAAGRGLEAAHAAGLVHRDVKPGNILVGRDGRVRIGDFGLVGIDAEARRTIAGTPGYMAPEQASGAEVDARADQYAFCVALAEALTGTGPPRWVTEPITRGRQADPAARWPSMGALLGALDRDPAVRRRRIAAGVAVTALAGVALWGARSRAADDDPCAGGEARLTGVWDDARKHAVHAAFVATGTPFAEETWPRVATRLDAYTGAWVDMHRAACRATRVERRQSDTLLDLRMQCLDRRLDALRALGDAWVASVDAEALRRAVDAAGALPAIDACANAAALAERAPLPVDPAARRGIAAVRAQLDTIGALAAVGRARDGAREAELARVEADATGWPQVRAEAALALGKAREQLDDPKAESPLLDAARLGEEARDDRLVAVALVELANVLSYDQQQLERSLLVARLAEGAVARTGDGDDLRGELLVVRGNAEVQAARYDDAQRDLDDAVRLLGGAHGEPKSWIDAVHSLEALAEARGDHARAEALIMVVLANSVVQFGATHPTVADALHSLGNVYEGAGDLPGARTAYLRSLAVKRQIYGETSAAYALTLSNLGNVEYEQGNPGAAIADYERAIAIREQVFGPDHPFVAMTLSNLAVLRKEQGRLAEARAMLERALAIKIKAYGPDNPSVAYPLDNLGDVLEAQGDLAGARAAIERALAVRSKALGADHPTTLVSAIKLGELDVRQNKPAAGRARFEQAIAALERREPAGGTLATALGDLARLELSAGSAPAAVTHLERAIAISTAADGNPATRGALRGLLARALWATGRRADADTQAHTADAELAGAGDAAAQDLRELRAWETTHGGATHVAR
jgi:tetratricopeptide (TPR) repeat protein